MHVHICDSTTVRDVVSGRYRWDFSDMFGPLFIRKNGEPLKKQPLPGSPAWTAFEAWHAQYRAADQEGAGNVQG